MVKELNSEMIIERPDYKKFLAIEISGYAITVLCMCISLALYWIAFLAMLSVGIYSFRYALRTVNILNTVCEGQGEKSWDGVTVMIISSITFNIYGIYWINKQSKRMEDKARQYKITISDRTALRWAVAGGVYKFIFGIVLSNWEMEYGNQLVFNVKYRCLVLGVYFVGVLLEVVCIYFFTKDLDSLVVCHNQHVHEQPSHELPPSPHVITQEPATIRDYSVYRYYLMFLSGMYEGIRFPLENNEYLVLGRESQKSNIVFEETTVSRQHCQIRYNTIKRKFEIIDHSSVGTYADGMRLEFEKESFFQAGAQIQLGSSDNIFILQEEKEIL